MNVVILSMQRVNNYGSLLQAYALKKIIEANGHTVQFIEIKTDDPQRELLTDELIGKYGRHSDDSLGRKIDKYLVTRVSNRIKTRAMLQKMEQFRVDELNITSDGSHTEYGKYDVCVIGADEVFNCMQDSPWRFTTQLYGNVPEAKKVITYAASCGNTRYEMLTKPMKEAVKEAFSHISAFSVRDKNTVDFVKLVSEQDAEIYFDPALVFDFRPFIKKPSIKLPEHYCLLYAYDKRIKAQEEIDAIKGFCKKNKLELVIAYGGQLWCRNLIPFSPFELLYAFQHADMVLTETFHGAIFSIKYAKRFGVICRKSNQNKLIDLLDRTGTDEHLINSIDELENKSKMLPKRKLIDLEISKGYDRTVKYLRDQI